MKPGGKSRKIPGGADIASFLEVFRWLGVSRAKYVIAGGVAANLHGLARGTKDIDLLIPKDVDNARLILEALANAPWGIARELTPEEVVGKPLTIIGDMPRVDLLLRAGKLSFDKGYARRKTRIIDGIRLPYLSLDDLIRSKDTGRPRDEVEIRELKALRKLGRT